jgi:hypothetical protein
MIPKGKLLALLLAFTAVGGLAATGAFTTVQAERTADVDVEGDSSALLQVTPNPDPSNSDFITQPNTDDSTFEIGLDDAVNARASTSAEDLFTITNNGQESVDVWIATEGGEQATNDTINTTFYIDDTKIVNSSETASGNNLQGIDDASAGDIRPLVSDIGSYNAFVDGDDTVDNTNVGDTDVVISEVEDGDNDLTPGKATPVSLAPGQSMVVSFAIEIDKGVPGSDSNEDILDNITILAINDNDEESASISQGLKANTTQTDF